MSLRTHFVLKLTLVVFVSVLFSQFAGISSTGLTPDPIVASAATHEKQSHQATYPDLIKYPHAWLLVSLKHQRVYVMNGKTKLYTMLASTGMHDSTPTGTFHIEAERGTYFYAPRFNEGAYDWVSWKDHGVYLFHSTPTDEQKNILPGPKADLGKRPSSHGCVHLSIPDAHWVYETIPTGTTVKIIKG
ncbi:L,D-transpeptidase [Furfurilactobacillus sp. WILCCON 0119]|uniref:L,D-transpeptidase n=1 Tax=Furfurilactobacillus entadae TaxID=2922307 RepID=UPI0035E963BE